MTYDSGITSSCFNIKKSHTVLVFGLIQIFTAAKHQIPYSPSHEVFVIVMLLCHEETGTHWLDGVRVASDTTDVSLHTL
jgi:hypothetical protein